MRGEDLWQKSYVRSIIHQLLEYVYLKVSGILFVFLLSEGPHWNTSPWKIHELYPTLSKLIIKWHSCSLVLTISFIQKIPLAILYSKHFSFYVWTIYFCEVFLFIILSTLACDYGFVYNLLSMALFPCDMQWQ